jgi:hypothetical protein
MSPVRIAAPTARPAALAVLLVAIFLAAPLARAQVATGAPPFSSTMSSTFDTVNNANLNVMFAVPVLSKAGKGMPFSFALAYNSSVWTPYNVNGQPGWTPASNWGWGNITSANSNYTTTRTVRSLNFDFGLSYFHSWVCC